MDYNFRTIFSLRQLSKMWFLGYCGIFLGNSKCVWWRWRWWFYINININIIYIDIYVSGRNGDTIRTMSRQSKAKIIVDRTDSTSTSSEFVEIELKGSQVAIVTAKVVALWKVLFIFCWSQDDDLVFMNFIQHSCRGIQNRLQQLHRRPRRWL